MTLLGTDPNSGADVVLGDTDRAQHLYVLGVTGAGKSTLLEQIVLQDMEAGDGVCFIDPHGDSLHKLLSLIPADRFDDLIYFNPNDWERPLGLNPFYCPDVRNVRLVSSTADNFVAALSSIREFADIFVTAPRMRNVLHHLAVTFVLNQGHTLVETPQFLNDVGYRRMFYPALDHPYYRRVMDFWIELDNRSDRDRHEIIDSSLNKLERFSYNPIMAGIFGQSKPFVNMREALDTGKILMVRLSRSELGEDNAGFIGAFLIWEILQAALSRSMDSSERPQFHLVVDEFQAFISSAFSRIIEEGRKFGIDVVVSHQERRQLDTRTQASTLSMGSKVVFRLTSDDAMAMAREFKVEPPPVEETVSSTRYETTNVPYTWFKTHDHTNEEAK